MLFRRHPLFLTFHFTLLPMMGNVEHELGADIVSAQHESLISKNTLLMYMRGNLTSRFHSEPCLGQVGIISYKKLFLKHLRQEM